jgi:multicomponent K+:H+ antiporter subunit D
MNSHLVIAPILLPFLVGVALLLLRDLPMAARRRIAAAAAVGQILLAMLLLCAVSNGDILVYQMGNWSAPWGIVLVADRLAVWMVLTTALLALFALLYASNGIDRSGRHFHVLFQMQLFGLSGAFLTGDLFNLFVFFEILLIASYGLLLHGDGAQRVRAGMHYVVLNLLGSSLFLFAAGLFYGVLGTLNLADLAVKIAATPPENLGLVRAAGLMLLGVFALKAALLPLYLWLPSAYASAAAPVAALFAIMTKVGAYAILRTHTLLFGPDAGPLADLFQPWLLPLALATLIFGMLGVIAATRIAQQAAYLVVASVGTLLIAFGLGSGDGIAAGLYYLPHSVFATAALFLLGDAIARRRNSNEDFLRPANDIPNAGLWGSLFFISAVLLAGLPPLSGFIGKFMILRAALAHPALPWIWGVMLVAALLGLIALVRSGSLLFFRSQADQTAKSTAPASWELVPIIGLLMLTAGLTIWAGPASDFARATAAQLLQPGAYIAAVLGGTQ